MTNDYEPVIIAFCCNWCSYAAADSAGTARMQYPSNIHIIRCMCSGMVHPNFVMDALTQGIADEFLSVVVILAIAIIRMATKGQKKEQKQLP